MSAQDNGGAAFPSSNSPDTGWYAEGMTLRDYFAAKAMHAVMATPKPMMGQITSDDVAQLSYQMADAMLKARQE